MGKICSVDECGRKHKGHGYCEKHLRRFKKYGDPIIGVISQERHGMSRCPEYSIWHDIKNRCLNKKDNYYYRYGGRGIKICDRWKNSFVYFYKDMGKKPTPSHQIDRRNNDGNYEPYNCRWVAPVVNVRNSSQTKLNIEKAKKIRELYSLKEKTITELSIMYSVTCQNICHIIKNKTWIKEN